MVKKIQYAHYGEMLQSEHDLMTACLHGVRQEAEKRGIVAASIGPANISFLEPFGTPYINRSYRPRVIAEIVQSDIPTLIRAGIRIGKRDLMGSISLKNIAIRTVFGASEQMPLRSLSYLLPALHIVEALRESGKFSSLPQIQYIVMAQAGIDLNRLEGSAVYRQAKLLGLFGQEYIRQFYPKLINNVVFAHDQHFMDHSEVLQVYSQMRHESEYFMRHPLVHDILYRNSPFISFGGGREVNVHPELLINVGGQREKQFYEARKLMLSLDVNVPLVERVQLFSHHRTPPYMAIEENGNRMGDLPFDQVLQNTRDIISYLARLASSHYENNLLNRDYEFLAKDTLNGFESFAEETAQKAKKII